MIAILNTILPVILMLVIGIAVRRTGLISREGVNALKSVVVYITGCDAKCFCHNGLFGE